MATSKVFADEVNYFKTSQSSPDNWMDKAKKEISKLPGGKVLSEAYGSMNGQGVFMLEFAIGKDAFKAIWPVLPVRNSKDERAAKVQAATLLFHDVKHRCVLTKVLGVRAAFFNYLLLPDGRTAAEVANPEMFAQLPQLLGAPMPIALPAGKGGDIVDGEFTVT